MRVWVKCDRSCDSGMQTETRDSQTPHIQGMIEGDRILLKINLPHW